MKFSISLFISLILLSNETFADNNTISENKYSSLKIRLDSSFSIKLLDSVSLIYSETYLDTHWKYDIPTKSFNYYWPNLPNGKYFLKIKTVFERIEICTIYLTTNTNIVISNMYDLINSTNLNKPEFENADSIGIYFRSSGCFHDSKQRITLQKIGNESYRLKYSYDSLAYEEKNGRIRMMEIPVFIYKKVKSNIIDSLFKLVNSSLIEQDKVVKTGPVCVSMTHENLYILISNSVFQFSDSGICEWDLYRKFKKEFIYDSD